MREHARALRSSGVPVGPAQGQGDPLAAHLEGERANLARLASAFGGGRLEDAFISMIGAPDVDPANLAWLDRDPR